MNGPYQVRAAPRLAGLPGKAWGWAVWETVCWLHSLIAQRFGPPRLAAVAPDQKELGSFLEQEETSRANGRDNEPHGSWD